MKKVVDVDGGLGRVIAFTGSLQLFTEKPIVVSHWIDVFLNNPLVHKVYGPDHRWLFDDVIKNCDYSHPEPYHSYFYYTQKHHLSESFSHLIHGNPVLNKPQLFLSCQEKGWANWLASEIRKATGKTKIVAYQPFGAGFSEHYDTTNRSLNMQSALKIADLVDSNTILLNCTQQNLNHSNVWHKEFTTRELFAAVSICDAILCVDSSVSHIGAAFDKKGVLMLGGTYKENVGYDNYYTFQKPGYPKSYFANRFHGFVDENAGAMDFTDEELSSLAAIINSGSYEHLAALQNSKGETQC